MKKIPFEQFEQMMSYDVVNNNASIEIEFCRDDIPHYNSCWMGKTLNEEISQAFFWYGLVPDGSQAYDFDSFQGFINAKVFNDNSLKEIWDSITLIAIDGCDIDWRLSHYLGIKSGPIRGPAKPV